MRSFTPLAFLALPLFGSVSADAHAPVSNVDAIYGSAHEAFQDLLNALPEDSLKAALSGLKDFKTGVFESHHRGVERVHDSNPALANKLIVAAVRDLRKRQAPPSNGTTPVPTTTQPPSSTPQPSSTQPPSSIESAQVPPTPSTTEPPPESTQPPPESTQPPPESTQPPPESTLSQPAQPSTQPPLPPPSSSAAPPAPTASSTARAVIVSVENTITTGGRTIVQTAEVLSEVTATVAVTIVSTNSQGATVTATENRPAIIQTTTDAAGRPQVTTAPGILAPTPGEVLTTTDIAGSTFLTTYTPTPGLVSSVKLVTTIGPDGTPVTMTSYRYVDPAQPTGTLTTPDQTQTARPGLQTGAANKNTAMGYVVVGGAVLALLV